MAIANISNANNKALTPLADADRVFRWHEHASLWFSLGVGLLVMQIGAYLVLAVGSRDAVLAIVLGSLIGSGLLAWTAKPASRHHNARLTSRRHCCGWLAWAIYHALAKWVPQWGSALPTLTLTFTLAWITQPNRT